MPLGRAAERLGVRLALGTPLGDSGLLRLMNGPFSSARTQSGAASVRPGWHRGWL